MRRILSGSASLALSDWRHMWRANKQRTHQLQRSIVDLQSTGGSVFRPRYVPSGRFAIGQPAWLNLSGAPDRQTWSCTLLVIQYTHAYNFNQTVIITLRLTGKFTLNLETSPLLRSNCALCRGNSGERFTTPTPTFYVAVSARDIVQNF